MLRGGGNSVCGNRNEAKRNIKKSLRKRRYIRGEEARMAEAGQAVTARVFNINGGG